MKETNLKLPKNYAAVTECELSCVEGGGMIANVFYAFGRMFRNTRYDTWSSEAASLEQAHGQVVSNINGVYTYSDGFTYSAAHGDSLSVTIGDFFYGLGDLFRAFGL